MDNLFKNDRFIIGVLLGLLTVSLCYCSVCLIEYFFLGTSENSYWFYSLHAALITLAINILLFRFMVVTWKKIETAKGMFLSIFILTMMFVVIKQYYFKNF